jgi:hypothetical protein
VKSKIPPEFGAAYRQVGEEGGEGVDAFGFHDIVYFCKSNRGLYLLWQG